MWLVCSTHGLCCHLGSDGDKERKSDPKKKYPEWYVQIWRCILCGEIYKGDVPKKKRKSPWADLRRDKGN